MIKISKKNGSYIIHDGTYITKFHNNISSVKTFKNGLRDQGMRHYNMYGNLYLSSFFVNDKLEGELIALNYAK